MPLLGYSTVWPTHLYRHSHHTTTGWSKTVGFGVCQMAVIPPNVAFGATSNAWFQGSFIFTKPYETRFAFSGWVALNCIWSFVGILACSLQFTWSYYEAAVDNIHFNPMYPNVVSPSIHAMFQLCRCAPWDLCRWVPGEAGEARIDRCHWRSSVISSEIKLGSGQPYMIHTKCVGRRNKFLDILWSYNGGIEH